MLPNIAAALAVALLLFPGVAEPSQGKALLRVEHSQVAIDAGQSLRVEEILVPAGSPAARVQPLVRMDTKKLQKRLDATRKELEEIQRGRRNPNPSDVTWASRETDAMRDLMEIQGRLASAAVNAPADGYVVRTLTHPGGMAKRRKPVLEFVPISGTLLSVVLVDADATLFEAGSIVSVQRPTGDHGFRSRVENFAADPSGSVTLALVPLELPFLQLGVEEPVEIEGAEPPR